MNVKSVLRYVELVVFLSLVGIIGYLISIIYTLNKTNSTLINEIRKISAPQATLSLTDDTVLQEKDREIAQLKDEVKKLTDEIEKIQQGRNKSISNNGVTAVSAPAELEKKLLEKDSLLAQKEEILKLKEEELRHQEEALRKLEDRVKEILQEE